MGGGRRLGTKIDEIVTVAENKVDRESDNLRKSGVAQQSGGGPPVVQVQLGKSLDGPRLDYKKSGSGSGSGNKGLQSNPTSNSSGRSAFDFNAHVTSILSSSDGKDSIIDDFVKEWLPGCSVNEIANFMRISGKKSKDKSYLHLKRHLPAAASRIENLLSNSWKPIHVAATLYGLQCLQEDDDGYLTIAAAMTAAFSKLIQNGQAVPSRSISMIIVGLQRNGLKARQSRDLVKSVTLAIESCTETFNAQEVGNALYGMQSMNSDHAEVRSMISALAGKVNSCKESLSAQNIGNALYGMKNMSSDHAEVRSMISALSGKVNSCKESLGAQEVANALYGMQSKSCDASFAIHALLSRHALALPHVEQMSRLDLLTIGQAVLLCFPSRREALDDASYEMWTTYGDSVCSEHRRKIRSGKSVGSSPSHLRRRIHDIARNVLGQSGAEISSNEYLFDIFESDIVVRIPFVGSTDEIEASTCGKLSVINIEVDDIHRRHEKKIKFRKLRDLYLKSRGVVVHRIDASLANKMKNIQVEQWLRDVAAR